MRQILIIFLLLIFSEHLISQDFNPQQLKSIAEKYHQRINQIKENTPDDQRQKYSEIIEIKGEMAHLQYIENGIPYYYRAHNVQARETTGVSYIQSEEGMNLSLYGEGITVGVWDEGQVRQSHKEFSDARVINKEGANFSNHASHVSGTILATGVNANAKGMAPLANGIAYTFNNDINSIAKEASEGLLLSNHSYGLILGWNYNSADEEWQWFGGDNDIDLRFGHYSSKSRAIDEIAYNSPYYTSVWSAGNDRSDVGNGTRAPDGPYMIVGPNGVAKNNIAVGAITGFSEYEDQTSAVMSSFSSWGPTADGRIKPDIVADGVGVFSVGAANDSAYSTLSGTSMAAPNATGSLVLAQEYYKNLKDTFMMSSTLKALAIHTARRTGNSIGPDAKFGWGVLNAVDMLKIIRDQNESDSLMIEASLNNNQTQIYEIFSDGITPITATMVWIDPPGNNGSPGNTDKMLINDLDLRIYDDSGVQYDSWELNQSNFDEAIAAGNHRDNVEKINLLSPKNRRYFVEVSHSGNIQNASQKYSLIISGNSMDLGESEVYNVGTADTIQSGFQWSNESGGEPIGNLDLSNHTLVFDDNSQVDGNKVFYLKEDIQLKNIINQNDASFIIDLLGNTLSIGGEIISPNGNLLVRNGNLFIEQEDFEEKEVYNLDVDGAEDLALILRNGIFNLNDDISIGSLIVDSAEVNLTEKEIFLNNLDIKNSATVNITESKIHLSGLAVLDLDNSSFQENTWHIFNSVLRTNNDVLDLGDTLEINDELTISNKSNVARIENRGGLTLDADVTSDYVEFAANSSVILNNAALFTINKEWSVLSEEGARVSIDGNNDIASIALGYREKLCFDYLDISNIEIKGESIVNAGTNSTLENTVNVQQDDCESILFADFSISGECTNKIIQISNKSSGENITEYKWKVSGGYIFNESNPEEPQIVFESNADQHQIELIISTELAEESFIKEVTLQENELRPVSIVANSAGLVSSVGGDKFIWYRNGEVLEEFTTRSIPEQEIAGIYHVQYFKTDSSCESRISEPFDIQILSNTKNVLRDVLIYPNPVNNTLFVDNVEAGDQIQLIDLNGKVVLKKNIQFRTKANLNTSNFDAGVYILQVKRKQFTKYLKIVKNE
jgi:hypothetical protein